MSPAKAAFLGAAVLTGALFLLGRTGFSWTVMAAASAAAALVLGAGFGGVRLLEGLHRLLRERVWRDEEGRFHAFAGVPLSVRDDGRHVWLGAQGLQQALRRREPDDVLAARMPGQWQRDERGRLWLRVDAVIAWLDTMPGRDDPRLRRLRRYLDREVLYPASRRHARR